MLKQCLLASAIAVAATAATAQTTSTPTLEELAAQVRAQQAQIEALSAAAEKGIGSGAAAALSRTTLGGYGEAQFYGFDNAPDQYDAYRFVLYVGHEFSDTVRLHSELELEHGLVADDACEFDDANNDGIVNTGELSCENAPGEVELEQMFLEWNYIGQQRLSVGQMLVPVGFLNETHEPETFYGARRNPVETNIVPTSWWEGGIKAAGEILPGLGYDVLVSTGLNDSTGNIRGGRQKGAKAVAEDLAYTARLKYTAITGLELGTTYQLQKDMSQGATTLDLKAELTEVHVGFQRAGFSTRALYAEWNIDNLAGGKEEQAGYFLEAGYKPLEKLGVFARYSAWDNQGADAVDSGKAQWNYGVNYWLTPRAVLKLDLQDQDLPTSGVDEDGFALGMGYSF